MKMLSLCCHIYKTFQLSKDDKSYTYANWLFEQSALSYPRIILLSNVNIHASTFHRLLITQLYWNIGRSQIWRWTWSIESALSFPCLCYSSIVLRLYLPHTDQLLFIFTQLYWNIDGWIVWICFSNILLSRDWRMRWE